VIDRPSPNHDARPAGKATDLIVLHYTGMPDAEAALERLTDPAAKVSSHYLIDEQGIVYRLVDESRRAWHAGVSYWAGERDMNGVSIGIELANPGHDFGYRPFPQLQMTALVELCRGILARHPIPRARIVGHSDVAPRRKIDPGELFDWQGLAAAGFGLWPEPLEGPADIASVLKTLAFIGYEIGMVETDEVARAAIAAFQRHFRPRRIDGVIDSETGNLIYGLARALKEASG
jgi:N-acetylmuramoyl-L-alanine amidase